MKKFKNLTGTWVKILFLTYAIICITMQTKSQMPAAITIEPPDATAYDELTLTFDPDSACFESGSLAGLPFVAMHSGVTLISGQQWQFVVEFNSTGANGQSTTLLPTGDGRFSITYTPSEFYGLNGETVTEICAVFNNGTNWNQDGRDFIPGSSDCMDFFIPLSFEPGDTMIGFMVNMNKVIYEGIFDPETDDVYVEIYELDEYLLYDGDQDGIYSENVYDNIIVGNTYEFIFRINTDIYEDFSRFVTPENQYTYVYAWWNDDTLSQITFVVDMNYQIDLGTFNPADDFVDIAGTMNNWQGSEPMEDLGNGIYSITYPFDNPGVVEYKFRINGDWATSEFPDGGPNRMTWAVNYPVTLSHFYDDYNTDTWPATFEVDMNNEIDAGNFDPLTDYLDIAGFFNNWDGHNVLFDRDWTANGIYTINLLIDKNFPYIEFKFRINGDWDTSEFPAGGPNRQWTVLDTTGGMVNLYECLYNFTDVPYPPYVYDLWIEGELVVGNEVTGIYTYFDPNWDEEGESIYQWFTSNNSGGVGPTPISGATYQSYTITEDEIGKYLGFIVQPVSATGVPAIGEPEFVVSDMIVITGKNEIENIRDRIYPNPFSHKTTIEYSLYNQDLVLLEIFDIKGQKITTLVNEKQHAGKYQIEFDASELPAGIYFFSLKTSQGKQTGKMVLIR